MIVATKEKWFCFDGYTLGELVYKQSMDAVISKHRYNKVVITFVINLYLRSWVRNMGATDGLEVLVQWSLMSLYWFQWPL